MTIHNQLAELSSLKDAKKSIEKQIKDIEAALAEAPRDKYILPNGLIATVAPNIRFDAATAKKNLTEEEFNSICKRKPDAALAKALLEDDYHKTQRDSGNKITFKNPND